DAVRHVARAMIDLHARDRELHRILFEEAPLPRRTRQMLVDLETRIIALVAALLATHPEVRVSNPELAAAVVVQTVEALTHRLVVPGRSDIDLDAYVDEIVRLVCRYLIVD